MSATRLLTDSASTGPHCRTRRLRRSFAACVVVTLSFTACSSGDDSVSTDPSVASDGDVGQGDVDQTDDAAADAAPVALQENGPIAVDGAPLAPYDMTTEDPAVGQPAPVVTGESFDGTEIVIGAPSENPTMVVFLAHWCPHCNDEVPVLADLDEAGRLPEGLDVVGVSTAVAADRENFPPSQWVVDKGWPWPTMADAEELDAINAYGGTGFPFTVVLDTDGTVLARRSGAATSDDTVAFLEAALATATA